MGLFGERKSKSLCRGAGGSRQSIQILKRLKFMKLELDNIRFEVCVCVGVSHRERLESTCHHGKSRAVRTNKQTHDSVIYDHARANHRATSQFEPS